MNTRDAVLALATIMRHRDAVRLNVQRLTQELERRAVAHDLSKLSTDEVEGFVEINRNARENPFGTAAYEVGKRKAMEPGGCIALHFSRNSHPPEYHETAADMGFLDIIEMVLDWKAAADTYGTNTLRDGVPHHYAQQEFTPEQKWLIESVVDWIEPTTESEGDHE